MNKNKADQIADKIWQNNNPIPLSNEDKKQLRELLINTFQEPMQQRGFTLKNKQGVYFRRILDGQQQLILSFQSRKGLSFIEVSATPGVLFDQVQELLAVQHSGAERRLLLSAPSISTTLGILQGSGIKYYPIAESGHISIVCQQLADDFDVVGEQYLQKYSDQKIILEHLMQADVGRDLMIWPPLYRAKLAVAIAYTLGDHQLVDQVINRQRDLLRGPLPNSLERFVQKPFEQFIKVLAQYHQQS